MLDQFLLPTQDAFLHYKHAEQLHCYQFCGEIQLPIQKKRN